jgi:hypothetical protein
MPLLFGPFGKTSLYLGAGAANQPSAGRFPQAPNRSLVAGGVTTHQGSRSATPFKALAAA